MARRHRLRPFGRGDGEARRIKVWTIFLAILAFSFSLLGTFLVRSGVLTSVHAFANDPRRGVFILAILAMFIAAVRPVRLARADAQAGRMFAPTRARGRWSSTTSC